jgi:hypothetical protein
MRFAFLFGSGPVTPDGCVRFANRDNPNGLDLEVEVVNGQSNSVENCLSACQNDGFTLAGLENGTLCCTCFTY